MASLYSCEQGSDITSDGLAISPGFRHDGRGHWLAEAEPIDPATALEADTRADVVIVGGGYAGLWTAWALRQRDPAARVVLVEASICGDGPSGRNAGFVNALWHRVDRLRERFGRAAALEICELADRSVDAIGAFAQARDLDIDFRRAGHLKVSTSAAQDDAWMPAVRACAALGVAQKYEPIAARQVSARCASPLFRSGAFMPQAATVQPALLARGLRAAALEAGVTICERTRARRITTGPGGEVLLETDRGGRVRAPAAVLAINASAAGFRPLRHRLAVTSTHMILTEPVADVLEELGWTGGECISTARRYLHYFRTTPDGRIAFGWGGGRLAYGGRLSGRVEVDPKLADRLRADILRFFPSLRGRRIDAAWGGPVDVSPTHLPIVGTLPGSRIHYVCGFTGNGVGPAHLAGEILASLALDRRDRLTRLALVEPALPAVPPEPVRYLGGSLVRAALVRQEDLEDSARPVDPVTRLVSEIPGRLGIHVGR